LAKTVVFLIVGFFAKTGVICIGSGVYTYQILRSRPLTGFDIIKAFVWTFLNTSLFLSEAEGGLKYVYALPVDVCPGDERVAHLALKTVSWYDSGWGPLLEKIGNVFTAMHLLLVAEGIDETFPGKTIDYRCDNRRFWLSAHNCQIPTPTSQNLELEQQIWIFGVD
jgi:hypothetical protein